MSPIDHFLRLARRGHHPAASSGEHRAHALAKALVEHLPGLDAQAFCGMVDFMYCVYDHPAHAAELLRKGDKCD